MLPWQIEFADMNDAILAEFGQPVTYWRPDSPHFPGGFDPITIDADVETGGEYASPTGPLYGSVYLLISNIPLGPQKGDLLIPSITSYSLIAGRTYRVDEIYLDATEGSATLKVRWGGPGTGQ